MSNNTNSSVSKIWIILLFAFLLTVSFGSGIALADVSDEFTGNEIIRESVNQMKYADDNEAMCVFIDDYASILLNQPHLYSLSFPKNMSAYLMDTQLVVRDLDKDDLSGISNGIISADSVVYGFMDVDLSSNKSELNSVLENENKNIKLTFTIPKTIDGNTINPRDLVIYRVVEVNGVKTLEKLNVAVSEAIDKDFYLVSVESTGFSPLVITSTAPANNSQSPGVYNSEASPLTFHPMDLADIFSLVTKIKGNFSLFSVSVVLVSSMFLWVYIRRSL